MRSTLDPDFCTPPRRSRQNRETNFGSGNTSGTGTGSSNNGSSFHARFEAGLSRVRDDRVDFLLESHDALMRSSSPGQSPSRDGIFGRGQVTPRTPTGSCFATPMSKMTPQSVATTVFYTPVSSWDRDSDIAPTGDYEMINLGRGEEWLNYGCPISNKVGANRIDDEKCEVFLSLNTKYSSMERCQNLLSKCMDSRKEIKEQLKVMGR